MCPRILLVDDSKTMRQVLKTYLIAPHYELVEAESGRRALEILAASQVDLVVSDVRMEDIDGIELVRSIRRKEVLGERVPIVLISGDHSANLRARCFLSGADEFLEKPLDPDGFRGIVDALLE
jgi:two-component system, chemotaxis family, chemotaxis protein CheY